MIPFAYSTAFRPPAPVVPVTVSPAPANSRRVQIDAQIDCGADRTVIPSSVAARLGLIPGGLLQFGVVGGTVTMPVYFVTIEIPGVAAFTVEAAGDDDEPHVLLGRDVLNSLVATLDGPAQTLELLAPPATSTP